MVTFLSHFPRLCWGKNESVYVCLNWQEYLCSHVSSRTRLAHWGHWTLTTSWVIYPKMTSVSQIQKGFMIVSTLTTNVVMILIYLKRAIYIKFATSVMSCNTLCILLPFPAYEQCREENSRVLWDHRFALDFSLRSSKSSCSVNGCLHIFSMKHCLF